MRTAIAPFAETSDVSGAFSAPIDAAQQKAVLAQLILLWTSLEEDDHDGVR